METKNYRNILAVRKVENAKKDITKRAFYTGASVLAIGFGVLGITMMGGEVIDAVNSQEALTLGNLVMTRFQGELVVLSGFTTVAGIYAGVTNSKKMIESISDYQKYKIELEKTSNERYRY